MTNLLASWNCKGEVHLVVGGTGIGGARISSILEAGATPVLVTSTEKSSLPISIQNFIDDDKVTFINRQVTVEDLSTLGRDLVGNVVDKVFVTLPSEASDLKQTLYDACMRQRIPINTADSPDLCSFTLLSTFTKGSFQMGVSTSGKGCKLASKIKRELVNSLPVEIDVICNNVGQLRQTIQEEDKIEFNVGDHDDDSVNTATLNALVKEFDMTPEQRRFTRSRWLSQMVEYYPLKSLATINIEDLAFEYQKFKEATTKEQKRLKISKGSISLIGAGPGSVSLLTLGAIHAINNADLVLADKLVPQQVLDIIPKKTDLFIARKFPGNAERAQQELLQLGLEAVTQGKQVVRLKQGDPYIFGRGGEEFIFFSSHGFIPEVIPGITSALAAPVLSNIPVTHRAVSDQVLICTGTGRHGKLPELPEFIKSRTSIFLMALHRIVELIPALIEQKQWDEDLPVAIVERASCPDQRVIRTTLKNVHTAVEACGSRPPGLFIAGYACEVLNQPKDQQWVVEEGLSSNTDITEFIEMLGGPEPLQPKAISVQ